MHAERAPRRAGLALGARRGATIRERNRVEACGRWCRGEGVYGDSRTLLVGRSHRRLDAAVRQETA